jgi:hypothetical protein
MFGVCSTERSLRRIFGRKAKKKYSTCDHVWVVDEKSGKDTVYLNIIYGTAPIEFAANEDYSVQQEMISVSGYK